MSLLPQPDTSLEGAITLHRAGRLADAEIAYQRVLASQPNNPAALHGLGVLCQQTGRAKEALDLLRRAVESAPTSAACRSSLAAVLGQQGRHVEAAGLLHEAVRLEPGNAVVHNNLGVALENLGRPAEAVDAYRRAIALRPGYAEAHNHLGNVLRALGRLAEAEAAHREAIRLKPDYAQGFNNLAATLNEQGRQGEAIEWHRQVVRLRPASAAAGSDLLHMLHYHPAYGRDRLRDEAVRWAETHAEPLTRVAAPHANDPRPDRPLRIGYVSADFREHPVARLMEPVLTNLDRSQFHAACYSDVRRPDEMTARLHAAAGTWRETAGLNDEQLAGIVRADQIDILVDLAGHMASNRLLTFARRPALVQVTHFNYPDTTGMSAMDWRLTDALSEPMGHADANSTERLYRLPDCAWVYQPPPNCAEPGPPPALRNGCITFAALNKPENFPSYFLSGR